MNELSTELIIVVGPPNMIYIGEEYQHNKPLHTSKIIH